MGGTPSGQTQMSGIFPSREERDRYLTSTRETRWPIKKIKILYIFFYLIQGFIATIPELIEGLDKIKDVMNQQRKITQSFGEAFDQCESCG